MYLSLRVMFLTGHVIDALPVVLADVAFYVAANEHRAEIGHRDKSSDDHQHDRPSNDSADTFYNGVCGRHRWLRPLRSVVEASAKAVK